jgi:uncharacterized protein (UPF0276 family)
VLADAARRVGAPLVSEHLAFVRAGGLASGHLLALPRTPEALAVVVANVRAARDALPVPLALENVSCLFEWPDARMSEAEFLARVLEEADVGLLLDVANLHANARNHRFDPLAFLDRVPLHRLAYVHVGGGREHGGIYRDTHAAAVVPEVLALLAEVCRRTPVPGVLLERDDDFPDEAALGAELDGIAAAAGLGPREVSRGHA